MAGIDETRIINGIFGAVYLDGKWLTNFTHVEASDEYDWTEIKLSGDRRTKHKLLGVKGSGTISGYKVTSELQKALVENPLGQYQVISKLDDPEAYGAERIRFSKVKFTKNNLANWKVGEIVEEEWPFVYDDEPEFVDAITAS
ncbi:MAG: phage tail tube protein [Syntrophomonas sp.]